MKLSRYALRFPSLQVERDCVSTFPISPFLTFPQAIALPTSVPQPYDMSSISSVVTKVLQILTPLSLPRIAEAVPFLFLKPIVTTPVFAYLKKKSFSG